MKPSSVVLVVALAVWGAVCAAITSTALDRTYGGLWSYLPGATLIPLWLCVFSALYESDPRRRDE